MSDDLYAPPRADLGAHGPPLLGTGDFDIARCFSEAWANTWENFPLWLGAGIVFVLASVGSVITILGILLALPVLAWGSFRFFLRMHDGGARVGDLFAGFSRYGSTLGPMLGFYLLTMLIGLPANAVVQIGARSSPPNLLVVVAGYLRRVPDRRSRHAARRGALRGVVANRTARLESRAADARDGRRLVRRSPRFLCGGNPGVRGRIHDVGLRLSPDLRRRTAARCVNLRAR
jgi:hypothetical protein